ncbi:hypothetical protein SAMN05660464_2465 [Geodermatophilus dictyosporus]|uniref:N-acetyltransferase domain-containing protein n=1 Tax=Geodermatophilus dictyosporus TaxID=1523247 RepID=A0A1I5NFM3_9ACTN|nr:GNAT family N-acetyltransferase [Geodermatophilus dictyosporus]SFP20146.1 hypothetical protein SAMN05660464_2465 [Geodermatophilus dictyosporus]
MSDGPVTAPSPDGVRVRRAREADLPALVGLHAQLHPELPPCDGDTAGRVWAALTATPGRVVLVAEVAGAVVGTADLAVMANLGHVGEPYPLVENVVVDAAHRRSGVGRVLLGGRPR